MSANEDTVRQGYEAFGKGDMDTLQSLMTPDVVQHVPGKSQLAGDYKGIDNVLAYYGRIFELTGGTFKADLKRTTPEGNDKIVAVHHIDAQRRGKSYDEDEKLHFTFTGGKISRLDEEHPDLAKFDDFWTKERDRAGANEKIVRRGYKAFGDLQSVEEKGDDTVVSRHHATAPRGDQKLDTTETLTFTIKNGKITKLVSSFETTRQTRRRKTSSRGRAS